MRDESDGREHASAFDIEHSESKDGEDLQSPGQRRRHKDKKKSTSPAITSEAQVSQETVQKADDIEGLRLALKTEKRRRRKVERVAAAASAESREQREQHDAIFDVSVAVACERDVAVAERNKALFELGEANVALAEVQSRAAIAESAAADVQKQLARVRAECEARIARARKEAAEGRSEALVAQIGRDEAKVRARTAEKEREVAQTEVAAALLARDKARATAHSCSSEVVRMLEALRCARHELQCVKDERDRLVVDAAAASTAASRKGPACMLCLCAVPEHLFLPCAHFGLCSACSQSYERNATISRRPSGETVVKCPICCRPSRLQQVYFS